MVNPTRVSLIAGEVRKHYHAAKALRRGVEFRPILEDVVRRLKLRDENFHEMLKEVGREISAGRKKTA